MDACCSIEVVASLPSSLSQSYAGADTVALVHSLERAANLLSLGSFSSERRFLWNERASERARKEPLHVKENQPGEGKGEREKLAHAASAHVYAHSLHKKANRGSARAAVKSKLVKERASERLVSLRLSYRDEDGLFVYERGMSVARERVGGNAMVLPVLSSLGRKVASERASEREVDRYLAPVAARR